MNEPMSPRDKTRADLHKALVSAKGAPLLPLPKFTAQYLAEYLANTLVPSWLHERKCETAGEEIAHVLLMVGLFPPDWIDAYRAEVLAEVTNPADAATIYADRLCICDETPHPTWCPASVPTDERITEIRNGVGEPLTARELNWLQGAAHRHELHVIGSRGGHWPLTDDLPGALLLVSQYLAAAMAVIERAGLVEEQATDPEFFRPDHTYTREHHGRTIRFLVTHISTPPGSTWRVAFGWRLNEDGDWEPTDSDDLTGWTDVTEGGGSR